MDIKDLFVHVNVSKHSARRLEIAAGVAKMFGAHLTAVYTSAIVDASYPKINGLTNDSEHGIRKWCVQNRNRARAMFDAAVTKSEVVADWAEVEVSDSNGLLSFARCRDLSIVGQVDPGELLPQDEHGTPEHLVLGSGRPALVIPYGGTCHTLGQRALIAWDGSAPCARAVNDALPFLQRAASVSVLTVVTDDQKNGPCGPIDQMVDHLSRHGIRVGVRRAVGSPSAQDTILAEASDGKADLLVMGAYGHSRAHEIVLGGVTRALFKGMPVPVLMSH